MEKEENHKLPFLDVLLDNHKIAIDEVKDGIIQSELPNTIEVKCQDKGPDGHKGEQSRYLDEERMAFVQNYLEGADDARSVKTETSDSGMETRSIPSEFEMEERSEFHHAYDPCLKDVSKELVRELTARLDFDKVSRDMFYKSFGLDQHKVPYYLGMRQEISELFPDTPINLLKDVCKALQLYDLVDLLEKVKPRRLRPALPLKEMAKLMYHRNRPTTVYRKAKVLIIDNKDSISRNTSLITHLFEKVCPGSEICSVVTTCSPTQERYFLEEERYAIEHAIRSIDRRISPRKWIKRDGEWEPLDTGPDVDQETVSKPYISTLLIPLSDDPVRKIGILKREKEDLLARKKYIEVMIKEEDLGKKELKAKLSLVCEEWSQGKGDQSVILFLFQLSAGARIRGSDPTTDIAIERLESFPTEAKFLLTPENWTITRDDGKLRNIISESLYVQYLHGDVVATISEILSKRYQTLDLISIMREVQRSVKGLIRITDNLSSIPRFREIEKLS
ncbi:uncharacterized protein [Montipora capricornis]|uniref:uncharacterized protein n=1 Tax=Montipora capricornis TaxID=246305 RepID=UPI0035F1F62A